MIITCNGCTKKFNLDSSLIPEQGRLLQCNGCNYKWFFKKKIVNLTITPIKIIKHDEKIKPFNEELSKSVKINNPKTEELLNEESNNHQFKEKNLTNNKDKKNKEIILKTRSIKNKKNYNILNLIIVFIISFIAIIITLDTFQAPISKIIPNIEFLLYSLYETINNVELFIKDLI